MPQKVRSDSLRVNERKRWRNRLYRIEEKRETEKCDRNQEKKKNDYFF
jgi:hypothetical protein